MKAYGGLLAWGGPWTSGALYIELHVAREPSHPAPVPSL